jgi:hypothetical protein
MASRLLMLIRRSADETNRTKDAELRERDAYDDVDTAAGSQKVGSALTRVRALAVVGLLLGANLAFHRALGHRLDSIGVG